MTSLGSGNIFDSLDEPWNPWIIQLQPLLNVGVSEKGVIYYIQQFGIEYDSAELNKCRINFFSVF